MKTNSRIFFAVGLLISGLAPVGSAQTIPLKSEILTAYVKVADALAADDLPAAQAAAEQLAEDSAKTKQSELSDQAKSVAKAAKISAARESFKALSASVEPLAAGEKGFIVMTCPMAKADWLQTSPAVRNPYYGKSMLTCGEPKKNVSADPKR